MPTPKRSKTPKPVKQPPPGWPKLTKAEKHLLQYPPTPKTWRCTKKLEREGARTECGMVNSNLRTKTCLYCGGKKPSKPVLLWPSYLAARQKAGIPLEEGAA
jgi:hypothetical protein